MKNFSSLIVVFLILCYWSSLDAQVVEGSDTSSNQAKKAFTFSFNGFSLSGGLGGTFWLNRNLAMRALINLSYEHTTDLTSDVSYYSTSVGATVYLMRHFGTNSSLSPYIGGGFGLTYFQYTSSYSSETSRSGAIKIPVLAGVEYWLTDHISLSGEQSIGFSLSVGKSSRRYEVSSSTSSLLLSFYP